MAYPKPEGPEIVPFKCFKTYISPHKIFPGRLHLFELDDSFFGRPGLQRPMLPRAPGGEKGNYRPNCRPVCGGETGTGDCKLFSQSFGVSMKFKRFAWLFCSVPITGWKSGGRSMSKSQTSGRLSIYLNICAYQFISFYYNTKNQIYSRNSKFSIQRIWKM